VTVAGARALAKSGRLTAADEVVLCITGNGLKTVQVVQGQIESLPLIAPSIREVNNLLDRAAAPAA
jgi:threonine synthase